MSTGAATCRANGCETVQQSRPDVVLVVGTMRDAAARRLDVNNPWTGPQDPQVRGVPAQRHRRADRRPGRRRRRGGPGDGAAGAQCREPGADPGSGPRPVGRRGVAAADRAPAGPRRQPRARLPRERGGPGRPGQRDPVLGGHRARSPAPGPVGADADLVRRRVQRGAAHRRRRLHRGGRLRHRRVAPAPAPRAPHGGRRGSTATRDRTRHAAAASAAGTGPPHRRCRTTGRRAGRGGLGRLHGRVRTRGLGRRQRRGRA